MPLDCFSRLVFGCVAMSDMVDGSAGVWQHISQRTPVPERDEIAQLIGHKIIDQNKVSSIVLMDDSDGIR